MRPAPARPGAHSRAHRERKAAAARRFDAATFTFDDEAPSPLRESLEWGAVIVGAVVIALLVRLLAVQSFFIPSESMVPTLKVHDRLLVDKVRFHLTDVHRGDIVVFKKPPREDAEGVNDLIKRVIGLPGETIEAKGGVVYINGKLLKEPYLPDSTYTGELPKTTIPAGMIWVMGDNREYSQDSRYFGAISEQLLIGKAVFRFWPIGSVGVP